MGGWRWLRISALAVRPQRRPASPDQLVSVPFAAPGFLRSVSLGGMATEVVIRAELIEGARSWR
jgi:hypothetical protein